MQMASFIEALQNDLNEIAAVGDEPTSEAARRLSQAIRASAGLRLLDALGEVALELSGQLPSGHVEIRMSGQDPSLVFVADAGEEQQVAAPADDPSARITLRLPEGLKASIEEAAGREGVSTNTWIVRALTRATTHRGQSGTPRVGSRLTGFAKS